MKFGVVFLLAAVGCSSPNSDFDQLQAQVKTLQGQVDALSKQLGEPAVAPTTDPTLAARVMALEIKVASIAAEKKVYLVAKSGQTDEKVIGIGAPGSYCAVSAELGGEVCWGPAGAGYDDIYFAGANCTGSAFAQTSRQVTRVIHGSDGAFYAATGNEGTMNASSWMDRAGQCGSIGGPNGLQVRELTLTARLPAYATTDLSVELR